MKLKRSVVLAVALCTLVAMGFGYWMSGGARTPDSAQLLTARIVLLPKPMALPSAALETASHEPFSADYFSGKWTLMLFGYTYCPDICPTTLAELRALYERLPEEARQRLRVVMVSVDPHRDTPELLQQYVEYFNPGFAGMTGTLDQVTLAANALRLPFVPGDTSQPGYTVSHSGNLALIGPDGQQRGLVSSPLDVDALADVLPALVRTR